MTVTAKIRRQGGAAFITISPALLKLMKLNVGGQVEIAWAREGGAVGHEIA